MIQEKEYAWLNRLDQEQQRQRDRLSKWEKEFLDNLLARFRIQRATLHVSPKQWQVITEIGDKIIH